MLKPLCLGALLPLLVASPVNAQSRIVYVDIGPCLEMKTDNERLECYASLGEEARSALAGAVNLPAPIVPDAVREEQQSPAEVAAKKAGNQTLQTAARFGLQTAAAVAQEISNAKILASENGTHELVGTIAKLDERMPNMWDVTLSNEQVWRQINSDVYRLQEGMEIRIYPSPFAGSFRMSAKGRNGFIQVRRIR